MSGSHSTSLRSSPAHTLRWMLALCALLAAALLALDGRQPGAPAGVPMTAAPATAMNEPDPMRDPLVRLGAAIEPISAADAEALGLAAGTALTVREVRPESQAARAGLMARDVITAIVGPVGPGTAGTATSSATWEALCSALDDRPTGGALDFFVRRDGRTRVVHVELQALQEAARAVAEVRELPQTACA